ncbi:hypothetical protein CR513_29438, partial [Mucuna pruriens]
MLKPQESKETTNIAGVGGITRSGRVYALEELRKKNDLHSKKKGKMEEQPKASEEREANEFLKLIRHSEYEMMDQLNKTSARISLLALLVNLEGHCQLLLKALSEAHVANDISVEKFGGIVGNLTATHHISFFGDELPK